MILPVLPFSPKPDTYSDTSKPIVNLTIDDIDVAVPAGTSVMQAAQAAGIHVSHLCASDRLKPFGSCRLCVVEIAGRKGLPASCTTPVENGMEVRTYSEQLARVRKNVMELYISDHPLDCLTCPANGECELQDAAGEVGLREVRYGQAGANHFEEPKDPSNPYFTFDPALCIVCSRCVRACDDIQGTFALTIAGRGFASKVSAGMDEGFLNSECVSCGACVQECPTGALMEDSIIATGQPDRIVKTTCGYCGVGCSFDAEIKGTEVVRMTPSVEGGANDGHSCVKGRFAWGYATHKDRITKPMVRDSIEDPWREVSWDEAIAETARRFKAIQKEYGREAIGGLSSSRCTNEEVYVVQKMVRTAFGNNNIDTCARVCHAPTGYGLKQTLGTSAGTQDFGSVAFADVIMVIGANPTDAHPVFGSRLKQRLRQGDKLIVVDPRKTDLVRSPHISATHHLQLLPGTNVAVINSLAHVIATEGLINEAFVAERCDTESFAEWLAFIKQPENSPEHTEQYTKVPASELRAAARLYATGRNSAIYFGLGVTEHSQGSTMVLGIANLAMATGQFGRDGTGVNPLRGQNNVQGSCDMGSFPHEFTGYRHVSDNTVRASFEKAWGVTLDAEPGLRTPNMLAAAVAGQFRGMFIQGEDIVVSEPNTNHVIEALKAMDCVVIQDLFMNETAKYAHIFLPGTTFIEKDGTFTNGERRINRVRPVMRPACDLLEWEVACKLSEAMGYSMHYDNAAQIMDEIAALTPTFSGVSFELLDRVGSLQWPCTAEKPLGTRIMHEEKFVRGKGRFLVTYYVPTEERSTRRFPLILTTGRTLTQYNAGTATRRTANTVWYDKDLLEIHPSDAEMRGIGNGDSVMLSSRKGSITIEALVTERVPEGVVYTTFHNPDVAANTLTTEYADWATSCPEYKVTAVEARPID